MFPPPCSSSSSSSILCKARPSENEQRKRRRLAAVDIRTLPIVAPPTVKVRRTKARKISAISSSSREKETDKGVGGNAAAAADSNKNKKRNNINNVSTGAAPVNDANDANDVGDDWATSTGGQEDWTETTAPTAADSTNKGAVGSATTPADPNNSGKNDEREKREKRKKRKRGEKDDLLGATVRIRKGKFAGCVGKIVERQNIRRVMLDSVRMSAFEMDDVVIVRRGDGARAPSAAGPTAGAAAAAAANNTPKENKAEEDDKESYEDLAKRYQGALVRVTGEKSAGMMGRVVRVIVGDWYITDNPDIVNAFQAHKFDVLKYAHEVDDDGGSGNDDDKTDCAASRWGGNDNMEVGLPEAAETIVENVIMPVEMAVQPQGDAGKQKNTEVGKVVGDSISADNGGAGNNAKGQKSDNNEEAGCDGHRPDRSLLGATIRITKGRYKDRTGTITEKTSIRRVQLDTIATPLDFADVEIIQRAPSASSDAGDGSADHSTTVVAKATASADGKNSSDFAKFAKKVRKKFMLARVRVLHPEENGGATEGTVIRVIVLGDWYIVDNPDVKTALPAHKFVVLRYADGVAAAPTVIDLCDDNTDDDDGTKECNGEVAKNAEDSSGGADKAANNVDRMLLPSADHRAVGKEDSKEEEAKSSSIDDTVPPKLPSVDYRNKFCGNEKDVVGHKEGSKENSSEDTNNASTNYILHPKRMPSPGGKDKRSGGKECDVVGHKEGLKENPREDTNNPPTNYILHPEPMPSPGDKNKGRADKECDVVGGKVDTEEEDTNNNESTGDDMFYPEMPSISDWNENCADEEDVDVVGGGEEDLNEDSKQDDATMTEVQDVAFTKVCSVELPAMENVELAARLSAFDAFLFLADAGGCSSTGNGNETSHLKSKISAKENHHGAVRVGSMKRMQDGDDINDTNTIVRETPATATAASTVASAATKPTESKEQDLMPQPDNRSSITSSSNQCANSNHIAITKVILQLIQQKQKSLQWPVVKVLPGMEVIVSDEHKRKQPLPPPLRMVPLEERIVRVVPGGLEERKEVAKRLGAFDDYLFLIDGK